MSFRKNVAYRVENVVVAGAWVKLLSASGVQRLGDLSTGTGQRVELAKNNSPGAGEFVVLSVEPKEYMLPPYEELWARCEGGAAGPAEVHGILYAE